MQWSDIRDALTDWGVWGHLIITSIGQTPNTPMHTCRPPLRTDYISTLMMTDVSVDLPTIIKSFDFNVSVANALTAPPYIMQGIAMILVVRHSDKVRERGYHGAFGGAYHVLCRLQSF